MNEPKRQISVVIHFLNAANYLSQAIESVLRQTFRDWELVLVDGGSTDDSVAVSKNFQEKFPDRIRILEHQGPTTLGIFSSRIWGATEATSPVVALLDSDDEWHPQFLERQYAIYQRVFADRPGMVYCPVTYWWEDMELAAHGYVQPVPPPGLHEPPTLLVPFLEEGYQRSAANSAVMIARELVLQAKPLIGAANEGMVEDQYLWSFLLTRMPVFVNPEPLVRYRQWGGSTCATTFKQGKAQSLRQGHLRWLYAYLQKCQVPHQEHLLQQIQRLINREFPLPHADDAMEQSARTLSETPWKKYIQSVLRHALPQHMFLRMQDAYRRAVWNGSQTWQQFQGIRCSFRARMRLTTGIEPLSYYWGDDRGSISIYRYYIERFLQECSSDIRGHCLEFEDDVYTSKFGRARVKKLDVLHVDASNPRATIVADLTMPNVIPNDVFDCIICTHVLHIIFRLDRMIAELFRILKPNGVLLIAVPHMSMCAPRCHELWRFTPEGLFRLLSEAFPSGQITIKPYGNSLTAAGIIRGLASHEFSQFELDAHRPDFAPEICARAVKTQEDDDRNLVCEPSQSR